MNRRSVQKNDWWINFTYKAQEWGKKATALSRQRGLPTGTAHDERFGRVRTYHREVLEEVIEE